MLATVAFALPLGITLRDRIDAEVRLQARGEADVVAATAPDLLGRSGRGGLGALARSAAHSVRGRVVIADAQGRVLADSAGSSSLHSSYAARPEIAAALGGRTTQVIRGSRTLGQDLLATAVPILRHGRPAGAVRVTQSVAAVHRAVRRSLAGLALVAAVVLLLGLGAALLIARQLAGPLARLEQTARSVADGRFERRARVEGTAEQRSLARSFNEMTGRLARALASQREFVADASHQLRTPLTGLRLRLEEAAAAGGSRAAVQAEVDAAHAELDRLAHVVDELLLLSSASEQAAPGGPVSLAQAASDVVARWRPAAAERAIEIADRTDSALVVRCRRGDLDRILDVLVENAINYSPPATTVRIRARAAGIEVVDAGPGLATGEEDAVFQRFHRGSAGRRGPAGTGLGLAIARALAHRCGGEVTLRAGVDGGTVATVELDAAMTAEAPEPATAVAR